MANEDVLTASQGTKHHLNECLRHLRHAESDTEKFAALLLVTKVVSASKCSTSDREQILTAISSSFLIRLLQTKKIPEGCSPLIYRSVAVSILAALTQDPIIACCAEMTQILPCVQQILKDVVMAETGPAESLLDGVVEDTLSVVSSVACTVTGGQLLLDTGYPAVLVQILASKRASDKDWMVKILAILVLMQQQLGTALWRGSVNAFTDLFSFLAADILESEDKTLLDRCRLMAYMLDCAPKTSILPRATCVHQLLKKLSSMLRSKLGMWQRQQVLALLERLTLCLGIECLQPPVVNDDKLLPLVLHLTCVEVRLAVENSTVEELQQARDALGLHYSILECLLQFLCAADEDEDLPLEAATFMQAHSALLSAVSGVFYLLLQVNSGAMTLSVLDPVVMASVRLIAVFTTQAFDEVKDNFIRLLPFLVNLCQTATSGSPRALTGNAFPLVGETGVHSASPAEDGGQSQELPAEDSAKTSAVSSSQSSAVKDREVAAPGLTEGASKAITVDETGRPDGIESVESDVQSGSACECDETKSDTAAALGDGASQVAISEQMKQLELEHCDTVSTDVGPPQGISGDKVTEADACDPRTVHTDSREQNSDSPKSDGPTPKDNSSGRDSTHSEAGKTNSACNHSASVSGDLPSRGGLSVSEDDKSADNGSQTGATHTSVGMGSDRGPGKERGGATVTDTNEDGTGKGDLLPRDLPALMDLIDRRPTNYLATFSSEELVEVVRLLLPVFDMMCDDDDARRAFVEQQGPDMLVQLVKHRQCRLMAATDQGVNILEQMLLADAVGVLTSLVAADETLCNTESFSLLFDMAVDTVPQLQDIPAVLVYKGSLIAAGLQLMLFADSQLTADQKAKGNSFLHSAITYVSGAPSRLSSTISAEAVVLKRHGQCLQNIWSMALSSLDRLLGKSPGLAGMFLELDFIPNITRLATQRQGSDIGKDSISAVMDVLETLAKADKRARKLLKDNSGILLARAHGRRELEAYLQEVS